jgi:hypothetical protein
MTLFFLGRMVVGKEAGKRTLKMEDESRKRNRLQTNYNTNDEAMKRDFQGYNFQNSLSFPASYQIAAGGREAIHGPRGTRYNKRARFPQSALCPIYLRSRKDVLLLLVLRGRSWHIPQKGSKIEFARLQVKSLHVTGVLKVVVAKEIQQVDRVRLSKVPAEVTTDQNKLFAIEEIVVQGHAEVRLRKAGVLLVVLKESEDTKLVLPLRDQVEKLAVALQNWKNHSGASSLSLLDRQPLFFAPGRCHSVKAVVVVLVPDRLDAFGLFTLDQRVLHNLFQSSGCRHGEAGEVSLVLSNVWMAHDLLGHDFLSKDLGRVVGTQHGRRTGNGPGIRRRLAEQRGTSRRQKCQPTTQHFEGLIATRTGWANGRIDGR